MITKTLGLKIAGFVALVLALLLVGRVFWSAETARVAEPGDAEQVQKADEGDSEAQTKTQRPEEKRAVEPAQPKQSETIAEKETNPRAEKLYQMALLQKKSGELSDRNYQIILECCHFILKEYPDSTQADKAKELLQEVPEQYQKEFNERTKLIYPREPKVKKSKTLRRRMPRRYPQRYDMPEEEVSISD